MWTAYKARETTDIAFLEFGHRCGNLEFKNGVSDRMNMQKGNYIAPVIACLGRHRGIAMGIVAALVFPWMTGLVAYPMANAQGTADASFFRSVETKSSNLGPFKKWTGAMERYTEEKAKEEKRTDCDSQKFNTCHYQLWQKFLDSVRSKPKDAQIEEVNNWANQRNYITDPRNWGEEDYWETPGEFIARFGDCEDYAIIKYLSLRNLGFTDDELRVVAVKDLNLKVGHAILVVFFGGKVLLLDNQIKKVVDTNIVRHYEPVFSINRSHWWRHRQV